MKENLVEIKEFEKSFGERKVVDKLCFAIKAGKLLDCSDQTVLERVRP